MSSVYTGVGSNVTQSTSPTITVPSDGDALAVTSVNIGLDKLMDYIALIFGGAFTGQASATPGLQGTGGASAQGGKFTAGGGASPVKGEVNLVPTTNAPSSPDNGDFWTTSAGVAGVRLNGVTERITLVSITPPSIVNMGRGFGTALNTGDIFLSTVKSQVTATSPGGTLPSPDVTYLMPFAGKLGTVRLRSTTGAAVNFTVKIFKNTTSVLTDSSWVIGSSGDFTRTIDASAVTFVAGDVFSITFAASNTTASFSMEASAPATFV